MNEQEFCEVLLEILVLDMEDYLSPISKVQTFRENGTLSIQQGLAVTTKSVQEFHLTITQVK